jgi:hypothetical protein
VQPAWLPLTFIVYPLPLKKTLMCERRELLALPPACWIAKSSAGAKGEECFVDDDVQALLGRVDTSGTNTAWVVQRYITDPLLYRGRKFDMRHWVLLLHDGSMWALSDGSCRTASVPYIDGCWSNSFVHLTNHSVQVPPPPSIAVAFVALLSLLPCRPRCHSSRQSPSGSTRTATSCRKKLILPPAVHFCNTFQATSSWPRTWPKLRPPALSPPSSPT